MTKLASTFLGYCYESDSNNFSQNGRSNGGVSGNFMTVYSRGNVSIKILFVFVCLVLTNNLIKKL